MKRILILIIGLIGVAYGQYSPTSAKSRFVNGLALGTKLDSYFNAADSNAIYWRADSSLMAKYKGTARALAFKGDSTGILSQVVRTYGNQTINGFKTFNEKAIFDSSVWVWRGKQKALQNVAVGYNSLLNNTYILNQFPPFAGGDLNVAIGYKALEENTDGRRNTAVGATTLNKTTTGNYNTAVGAVAMFRNTTGVGNTALGVQALQYNTTGIYNTALGTSALLYNETADYNVAIGRQTLLNATTGGYNTAVGSQAMQTSTTGIDNTALGYASLFSNTTGGYNLGLGIQAGYDVTTGSNNIFLGRNTGRGITTGSGNNILGGQVTGLSPTLENYTIIADGVGNRRINIPASGNVLIGTETDDLTAQLVVNGNAKVTGVLLMGQNVAMNGTSNYVDFRGTNYARFANTDGTTQYGYIQHNATDMVLQNDVSGGKFLFNKAVTITGKMTADTIVKSGGTSSQYLMADGSVRTNVTSSIDTGRAAAQIVTGGSLNSVRDSVINAAVLKTGSTMTGTLNGTDASYSGSISGATFQSVGVTPSNTAGFNNTLYLERNVPSLTLSNTGTNTGKFTLGVSNGAIGFWNNATSAYEIQIDPITSQAININRATVIASSTTTPKIIGNSSTPSIAGGSATYIGTGASTSVSGNDMAGEITLVTGTGCTSTGASNRSALSVTFSSAYTAAPIVQIQAIQQGGLSSTDGPTNQTFFLRRDAVGTSGFTVYLPVGTTLTDSTTYLITYQVIGR